MKQTTSDNLKIVALGLASALLLGGIAILVALAGLWDEFEVALDTAGVFIIAGVWYGKGLRRLRPLCVFISAILLHVAVEVLYLHSAHHLPNLSFWILFAPLEATGVGVLLMLVGGLPRRSSHRNRSSGEGGVKRKGVKEKGSENV